MDLPVVYAVTVVLLLTVAGCTVSESDIGDTAPTIELPSLFEGVAEVVAVGIEILGIAVITKGAITAGMAFFRGWFDAVQALEACYDYRVQMGQAILLGLEFLVAADIIRTVAVRPTFRSVGILAAIVAIRTFLSFALEIEIAGRLPWRAHRD